MDAARERIGDLHLQQLAVDRRVEAHRGGDAELAAVGAGARDVVGDLLRAGLAELQLLETVPEVVDRLVADPAEDEVLADGHAGVAAREVAHDLAEAAELLGREVTAVDLDLDGTEARLALGDDVGLAEAVERGAVLVVGRRAEGLRHARRDGLLVEVEAARRDREVALGDPVALELLLDLGAQLVDAELVDEDLDAGAGAVDAQPVLGVEDPEDGLGDLEVVAVVGLDEVIQRGRDARHDRRAAADDDLRSP